MLGESAAGSAIGRLADLDFQTYLTDDINVKVDIASMAHALEVRCPYLDTDVVEFAARLPADMLMRARGKYLLRRVAKGRVPEPILRRRKRGFALPLKRWLRQDLRQMIHDVLLDRTARERGLFAPAMSVARPSLEREVHERGPDLDPAHARTVVSGVHRCPAFEAAPAAGAVTQPSVDQQRWVREMPETTIEKLGGLLVGVEPRLPRARFASAWRQRCRRT